MRRLFPLQRKHAAWLALLGIWLHALLPVLHHPAGMALAGVPAGIDQRFICHAPVDQPSAPQGPDKAHHLPPCLLCQSVQTICGFAPPQLASVVPSLGIARITYVIPARVASTTPRLYRPQQPRAPPILA